MHIKELSIAEFDAFSKTCPLTTYHQTSNYALFMAENNYDYELIGYVNELGIIKAAALILIKKLSLSYKYGYSPKGFLIDYFDFELLQNFTNDLKNYYKKKLVFIKINPEIAIGQIDHRTKLTNYNQNIIIRDYLKELGYLKLKDNIYFESLLPRYNGIINLKSYDFKNLTKNTRNKIRKAQKKGLEFIKGNRESIAILNEFIQKKKEIEPFYYENYYNIFSQNADVFLIKINYEQYLLNSKQLYDKELERNTLLANNLMNYPTEENIKEKMVSDKILLSYKDDIALATHHLTNNIKEKFIAGAFIITYQNRVNIVISGIDPKYRSFNANYYLHYNIIEYYKNNYKFLDLNGLTGDFTINNPYKGLNEFKLGFNPNIYEFIGEFDLVFNKEAYSILIKKGILAKEFNKKTKIN